MTPDQGQSGVSGAAQQAKEKGQEMASQAQQQVQEKAQVVKSEAGGRLREQVDQRSTQLGEQTQSLAGTVRQTAEQLRNQGNDRHAQVAEQAADRVERMGSYLRDSDGDKILGDVEDFARRRPWVVGGAGALLGFIASRFLKASSGQRYESRQPSYATSTYGTYEGTYPDLPSAPIGTAYVDETGSPYVSGAGVVEGTDRGAR
jgi:hypothetical protein